MKMSFKLAAAAVALGISGVASAQSFSTTSLNVIAYDATTNNYFDAVLTQPIVTSSGAATASTVNLSSFSAWATYVAAEGASLANTNFIVFGGAAGKSANGDIGISSTVNAPTTLSAATLGSFFGASFVGSAPAPAAGTGSEGNSSAAIVSIQSGNAVVGSTINAADGGTLNIENYTATTGALVETVAVSASAGTLTFAPLVTATPEPGTFAMMGAGLLAAGAMVRRRTRN